MLDVGLYNMDCMIGMKEFPDNYFDLAIVDPPYGAGLTENGGCKGWFSKYHQEPETLENLGGGTAETIQPIRSEVRQIQAGGITCSESGNQVRVTRVGGSWAKKYAKKSFRGTQRRKRNILKSFSVSHVIRLYGGGNYFELPPTRCFLIWRKLSISENFSMAMAEYAWTSFNENAKVFEYTPQARPGDDRFHPTQKPVALYEWILNRYAKPGDKILDTHVGSASSLIACYNTNHKYVGFEIDETYYNLAKKRLEQATAQRNIFEWMDYTE